MKAIAVMAPGRVSLAEVPLPQTGDYECLVKIHACGLCNSTDSKIIGNHAADMQIHYPTVLGHEGVGSIVQVGARVRNWHVGDRIVSPVGRIDPASGFQAHFGQMAEYGVTHDIQAMMEDGIPLAGQPPIPDYRGKLIPDWLDTIDAVMLLTFKENYSALQNFGMREGMRVLVYGDGPVALGLCRIARCLGAAYVGCAGHHDDRLAKIRDIGHADLVINTHRDSLMDAVGTQRFDLAIDAVGDAGIVLEGARLLSPGGRIGAYGVMPKDRATLNLHALPNNVCLHLLNWPFHEHRAHEAVLALVQSGQLVPKDFYSHVLPMEAYAEGIALIRERKAYKVIFTMEEGAR